MALKRQDADRIWLDFVLLTETNPLEDLRGLILSPRRFSSAVSHLQSHELRGFVLWKSLAGAMFFFSLYFLSSIPSSMQGVLQTMNKLQELSQPFLLRYGVDASDILSAKVFMALAVQISFFVAFFFRLLAGFLGIILLSGLIALWKGINFREAFVTVSYAHWILFVALIAHGPLGYLGVQILLVLFVANVLIQKVPSTVRFYRVKTFFAVGSFVGLVALYNLALA